MSNPQLIQNSKFKIQNSLNVPLVLLRVVLEVLRYFPFRAIAESVGLVVLADIQTHALRLDADTHRNHLVRDPIECEADDERVGDDDGDAQYAIEELRPVAVNQTRVREDPREDGGEDTAHSVGWEHVERIVDA